MNQILKLYYGIDKEVSPPQYFYYQNQLYYFTNIDLQVLEIYQYYRYLMNQCGYQGYTLIKNFNDEVHSHQHMLLLYNECQFDFLTYTRVFLQPIPQNKMMITHIKEQWISKIDNVKEMVKQYAYSFKHNPELVSLIYYYTGLGENSISILNEILLMNKNASIMMGLSLKHKVSHYVYDVLNPTHYVMSSRMRQLVYLVKSQLLTGEMLKELLETQYFDLYELLYFYARLLFPSTFFDDVLNHQLSPERINEYFFEVEKEKKLYQEMTVILSFYVSLPKIGWINRKNMI